LNLTCCYVLFLFLYTFINIWNLCVNFVFLNIKIIHLFALKFYFIVLINFNFDFMIFNFILIIVAGTAQEYIVDEIEAK